MDVRMTIRKHSALKSSLDGKMMQKKIKGHIANESAAPMPHSQVSFILVQHAKTVSPMVIAVVVTAATMTSSGSNHWENPATM